MCEHSSRRHAGTCKKLIGSCFRCGTIEHFIRDYPRLHTAITPWSKRFASIPKGAEAEVESR